MWTAAEGVGEAAIDRSSTKKIAFWSPYRSPIPPVGPQTSGSQNFVHFGRLRTIRHGRP